MSYAGIEPASCRKNRDAIGTVYFTRFPHFQANITMLADLSAGNPRGRLSSGSHVSWFRSALASHRPFHRSTLD